MSLRKKIAMEIASFSGSVLKDVISRVSIAAATAR